MGLRALGGVRQIGYIVGSVLAPGSFREASTLKADQAGNTSNKTTKGGASRCGRWTVRTHRGEGDKLGADAVEGCRFEAQSERGDCSRHTCGKRQDVNSCLRVLRARLSALAQVAGVQSDGRRGSPPSRHHSHGSP